MSGTPVVIGSTEPWSGGWAGDLSQCILAPNPSPMTLDGTNTWLLGASDSPELVLVDPGPDDPAHLRAVQTALGDRGARVGVILLTHGHVDHSAGARLFAAELNAPVRALDPTHRYGGEGLAAGEVVAGGDVTVDVVGTPGHSSDSLSFSIRDAGVILTGDTVLGRGTTVVAYPDGSLAEYLASLQRLRSLALASEAHLMLPGHGPTVTEPEALLDAYIAHRAERLEQVRVAIAAGAESPMDVVEQVYQPIPDAVIPAALASVRAQWDYLQPAR